MKSRRDLDNSGFTLIELIIVIAILSIISAIAIPKFSGIIETARLKADKASIRILNNTTTIFKISESISSDDVFHGLSSDEDRINLLVDSNYLSVAPLPNQTDASLKWHTDSQIWRIHIGDEIVPLSPLGDDFDDISSGIIEMIIDYHNDNSSYGQTWGDAQYTDIGLDPDDWQNPINHMTYKPIGKILSISPEEGYEFQLENYGYDSDGDGNIDVDVETIKFTKGWNLIYNTENGNWYYRSIADENIVNIETLRVEKKV